jgi:cytochrome P450
VDVEAGGRGRIVTATDRSADHDHGHGDVDGDGHVDEPAELGIDDLVRRDQAAIRCPYPIFARLRHERPVVFNDALGAWVVTRYDDVLAVLHDTARFSSRMPTGPQVVGSVLAESMATLAAEPEMAEVFEAVMGRRGQAAVLLNADPPDHRRQRVLVNGAFRPFQLRALEPKVYDVATRLVDEFADASLEGEDGRIAVEFVSRFAVGLPMEIIAHALGVAGDDLARFKRWSDDLVMPVGNHAPTVEQTRRYLVSSKEFAEYFSAKLAERRANPTGDIISDVATAELDGEQLSEAEMLGMLQQFLVAGNETTTNLLTNIAHRLAIDTELQARIRADRTLVDGLVEEALRFEAPVGGLFRQAKEDVDVGGVRVPAGDHVWLLYASANRDADRFDEPDTFDPCRANVRDHLAFGHGEHFCIGAGLARAEARVGTNVILDRMADIALGDGNDFPCADTFVLRGLQRLHLTFHNFHVTCRPTSRPF